MHPTPQEQLGALAGIIAEVAANEQLPADAQQRLTLAVGQLRRLAGNVSARLPFLQHDNERTEALLGDLGALPTVAAVELSLLDEPVAHERNKALRAALSELIGRLADDAAGDQARARIAAHLRARTQADPALNRPRGAIRP